MIFLSSHFSPSDNNFFLLIHNRDKILKNFPASEVIAIKHLNALRGQANATIVSRFLFIPAFFIDIFTFHSFLQYIFCTILPGGRQQIRQCAFPDRFRKLWEEAKIHVLGRKKAWGKFLCLLKNLFSDFIKSWFDLRFLIYFVANVQGRPTSKAHRHLICLRGEEENNDGILLFLITFSLRCIMYSIFCISSKLRRA